MSQNCCTCQVWTAPPSPKPLWEILGMRKNPTQQPKIYSFAPSEKSPLIDLNLSLSKASFVAAVISVVHILNFRLYVHMYHAKHEKSIEWLKLYGNQNFCSLPPVLFVILLNSAFIIACFPLFHTSLFISHFIKFQLHSNWGFVACRRIKYNRFQISRNKSYKTTYSMP